MNKPKTFYPSLERRKPENTQFRGELDQVGKNQSEATRIKKKEIAYLFGLVREYCQREGGRGSQKVFRLIREERSDELSPELLALLDELIS